MFAQIAQFTQACSEGDLPKRARAFDTSFIGRMIVEETMELLLCSMSQEEAIALITKSAQECKPITPSTEETRLGDIADALCDITFYIGDSAARHGLDLDPVMALVHKANMAKIVHGKVLRDEHGKIQKPVGWVAPQVHLEMERQRNGTISWD